MLPVWHREPHRGSFQDPRRGSLAWTGNALKRPYAQAGRLGLLCKRLGAQFKQKPTSLLLGGLAATTKSGEASPAIAGAKAAEVDPIFAAIAAYKEALRERSEVLDAEDDEEVFPTYEEWDEAQDDARDAEFEAHGALFDTTPTTIAGVAALLELLATDPYRDECGDPGPTVLGWAYNDGDESSIAKAANQQLFTLAAALRTAALRTSAATG
jgi:hypothetical protein